MWWVLPAQARKLTLPPSAVPQISLSMASNHPTLPNNSPTGRVQESEGGAVDNQIFNNYWLEKVNGVRNDLGMEPYNLHQWLVRAAQDRSDYSKSLWSISHKKYWSTSYYNRALIQQYVESKGVVFTDKPGTKVVENIGWWYVYCPFGSPWDSDRNVDKNCTSQILEATESTRKFFMDEKWKRYAPHYKSMISSQYTEAWFGVAIDHVTHRYYFTAYYSVPTE